MKKARIFVSGLVQGVGFRKFVKKEAQNLNLNGFVRNLEDGRVEVLLEGNKDTIEKMIHIIKKGKPGSKVSSTEVFWEEGPQHSDFSVQNNLYKT